MTDSAALALDASFASLFVVAALHARRGYLRGVPWPELAGDAACAFLVLAWFLAGAGISGGSRLFLVLALACAAIPLVRGLPFRRRTGTRL